MFPLQIDSFSTTKTHVNEDSVVVNDFTNVYLYATTIEEQKPEKEFLFLKYDTWASALITLLTFFLGYGLSYVSRKTQLSNRLRTNQRFISTWVDLIGDQVKKQVEGYTDFAKQIQDLDTLPEGLPIYNLHMDKLIPFTE